MGDSDWLDDIDWDEQERIARERIEKIQREKANDGQQDSAWTSTATNPVPNPQHMGSLPNPCTSSYPAASNQLPNTHNSSFQPCQQTAGPSLNNPQAQWNLQSNNTANPSKSGPWVNMDLSNNEPQNRAVKITEEPQADKELGCAKQGNGSGSRFQVDRGAVSASASNAGFMTSPARKYGPGRGSPGRGYRQSPQKRRAHMEWRVQNLPPPKRPFEKCPGVYAQCGGELIWMSGSGSRSFWYCALAPICKFRYFVEEQLDTPMLSMEVVSEIAFKVCPSTGGESAVMAFGGLKAVLERAGINFQKHIPLEEKDDHVQDSLLFALDTYDDFEKVLLQYRDVLIKRGGRILRPVLGTLRWGSRTKEDGHEVDRRYAMMPSGLENALLQFQRAGVRFGLERKGRCLIADEMGVGKTLQAIALSTCYQDEWPLLAVVPASLRLVWAEELEKWLPGIRPSDVHVIEGKHDALRSGKTVPKVIITSYEMMKRLSCDACCKGRPFKQGKLKMACQSKDDCLASFGFKVAIVDESHNLKTTKNREHDAATTEAVIAAVKCSKRCVLLTGTPSLTRPFDLYRQVDALRPGLLTGDKIHFADRYCGRKLVPVYGQDTYRYDLSGGSHLRELHTLLSKEIMIRRLKRDVLSELPPKRRQVVRLPKPPQHHWPPIENSRKRKAAPDEESEDPEEDSCNAEDSDSKKMSREHRTGLAKLPAVIEWLKDALGAQPSSQCVEMQSTHQTTRPANREECGPKLLVFAHHRAVMDGLAAAFETLLHKESDHQGLEPSGVPFVRVDGECDSAERLEAIRRFKCDPSVRVALLSITAAGVGLDFSSASAVVFVELPREVSLVQQAEDRAHRKGQKNCVNVYFLCAKGTVDDECWQRLGVSLENISAVHDGDSPAEKTARSLWKKNTVADQDLQGAGLRVDEVLDNVLDTHPLAKPNSRPEPSAVPPTQPPEEELESQDQSLNIQEVVAPVIKIEEGEQEEILDEHNVWFEVSGKTSRVHLHLSEDGNLPMGVSIPFDALIAEDFGLLSALTELLVKQREFMGPFGRVSVSRVFRNVDRVIQYAQEFAKEWDELRAVHKNKLHGKVIRHPLHDIVERINQAAQATGALGCSTDRFLDLRARELPDWATWETVSVQFPREVTARAHKQPFHATTGKRLCLNCFSEVQDCGGGPEAVVSSSFLFCCAECEVRFGMKLNAGALRRELFKHEKGVCQMCGLDCHALVRRLQAIRVHSRNWKSNRERVVRTLAPKIASHGYLKYFDKLVAQAFEGNAWHADHIHPVYKGGGQCGVENMRSLCVPCHCDVTKQQVKERAAERAAERQKRVGTIRHMPVITDTPEDPSQQMDESRMATQKKPRPRRILNKIYQDEPEDDSKDSRKDSSKDSRKCGMGDRTKEEDQVRRPRRRVLKKIYHEDSDDFKTPK